ncbi:MAG: PAS domain S-box protein, partial [Candidatus Deferrimicrobiaceae bacterium]
MSSSRPRSSSTPDRVTPFRWILYGFLVLFMGNLGAMADLVFHPEIPYFDEEHLLVGGINAIAMILLLGILETYLVRRGRIEATRGESEEKLRKSESLYHDLVETSQDLIWQCDGEGRYIYLNPAWEDVFGYKVEEMLGKKFTDFQRSETAADDMNEFVRLLGGGTVKGHETTHFHRDGRGIRLVFNAKSVTDDRGKIIGTRGTAYDITDRKRAEEELTESVERLDEAQKVAHLGYYALDVATGSWTSSKILDDIFGIGDDYRRDVEGWSLIIHPEERRSMLEYFRDDVLVKKRPFDREYRIVRRADNCVRCVHGLGKVERDSMDRPVKMIGTIQDVTERKRAEEEKKKLEEQVRQAQKMESLGVMAGGIAHDFNNLLMAVLGHAELALNEISPMSAARGSLAEITTAARRAADLCRQMLAYAGKSSFA